MSVLLPVAQSVLKAGSWSGDADLLHLTYEGRFLRRRRVTTAGGRDVMIDLPETTSLNDGDALSLDTGGQVRVVAADEPLVAVKGPDLARLAWHIGNRHTPCQIGADRLFILRDHVLEEMLAGLGATVTPVMAPFRPEGGAYGLGRTMGHDHGPAATHRQVHHHGSHHADEEEGAPDV
jgi:urease accessory protein